MLRPCALSLLLAALAGPALADDGAAEAPLVADPLVQAVATALQERLADEGTGLSLSKSWPVDANAVVGILLPDAGEAGQRRALELARWGVGLAARGPDAGVIVHIVRCGSADEAEELAALLRADAERAMAAVGAEGPRELTLDARARGFEVEVAGQGTRHARAVVAAGGFVLYALAMDVPRAGIARRLAGDALGALRAQVAPALGGGWRVQFPHGPPEALTRTSPAGTTIRMWNLALDGLLFQAVSQELPREEVERKGPQRVIDDVLVGARTVLARRGFTLDGHEAVERPRGEVPGKELRLEATGPDGVPARYRSWVLLDGTRLVQLTVTTFDAARFDEAGARWFFDSLERP